MFNTYLLNEYMPEMAQVLCWSLGYNKTLIGPEQKQKWLLSKSGLSWVLIKASKKTEIQDAKDQQYVTSFPLNHFSYIYKTVKNKNK